MSDHVFRKAGLGYVLELPSIFTTFNLDHLYRTRGELHAVLTVRSAWPGAKTNDGVMLAAQMTITSLSARKTFSKSLEERAPVADERDKLDWYGFLEELCQGVIASERDGSPIEEIGNLEATERPPALLFPILERMQSTILFGDSGTGKSMLAFGLAVSLRTGKEVIPGVKPDGSTEVLYLDWETSREEADRRIKAICAAAEVPPQRVWYRRCYDPLYQIVESVSREVVDREVGLLIADHAGGAMGFSREGGDPAEPPLRMFNALRIIDTTALIIDHVGKPNGTETHKPYGSSYKAHLARATWELQQAREPDGDGVHIAIHHRKHNNTQKYPSMGFAMAAADDYVAWESEEIFDAHLATAMTNADRVATALRLHPLRVREIANQTGLTENVIRVTLSRYRGARFEKIETGDWKVIEGGAQQ